MQNLLDAGPHAAYLDAIFARIDRIRLIDASVLTERYGIDPAELTPSDGATFSSWMVERALADADAQRQELHGHLEGLTREFVSEGPEYEVAVSKAQRCLGDPSTLAVQLSQAVAQQALGVDGRWKAFVRPLHPIVYLGLIAVGPILTILSPENATTILNICMGILIPLGFVYGYGHATCISVEMRACLASMIANLTSLLALKAQEKLTRTQRRNRRHLSRKVVDLKVMYALSDEIGDNEDGPRDLEIWGLVALGLSFLALLMTQFHQFASLHLLNLWLICTMFASGRKIGVRLGIKLARRRHRLKN